MDYEDKIKEILAKNLVGRIIRNRQGEGKITKVEINYNLGKKSYEHRIKNINGRWYPDLVVFHTGLKMAFRELSNPFYIEIILGDEVFETLNQMLPYKYLCLKNIFKKYGDVHVVFSNLSLLTRGVFNKNFDKDMLLTRVFWHLGFGVLRKATRSLKDSGSAFRGIRFGKLSDNASFVVEFNEQEWFEVIR